MSRWLGLCALLVACAGGAASTTKPTGKADVVFVGGDVWTNDPARPKVDAIAITNAHIAAVGTAGELAPWIGPTTVVIELGGRTLTPGLVDAHAHLHGLGHWSSMVSLRGAKSEADAVARVVAAPGPAQGGDEWVQGRGWDQNLWSPQAFPTKASLDAALPGRPIVLRRVDGHAMWVSAKTLAVAGITKATPDPAGGRIVRDAQGEPTGVLVDAAMDLVAAKIPADTAAQTEAKILAAQEMALTAGLTEIHDMGVTDEIVRAYRALDASGRLQLRVVAYLDGEKAKDATFFDGKAPDHDPDGTRRFAVVGVKLYADGALGSRGAALLAPYADEPSQSGLVVTPPETLTAVAKAALAGGWQVATHAIGDRGNRITLDAYEAAGVTGKDARFRLEHAQVLALDDLPRLGKLGVIASMQPTHATSDMGWAEARVGPERIKGAYAWRSLLNAGAHLAFGSDFPVEEVSPLYGLWSATSRQDLDGKPEGGWRPEEKLTLEEAVAAFTSGAAYAVHQEAHRGRLAVGYVADLTIFDRPLLDGPALRENTAWMTIVNGQVAFDGRK